jgi:hypothetical protein
MLIYISRWNNTPFHRPQQDSTLVNYAGEAVKLILFLMRKQDVFPLPLHDSLEDGIQHLRTVLQQEDEDELYHSEASEEALQSLHIIFSGLWMHDWIATLETPFPDPTICYLALCSLKMDGSFLKPKQVTHSLAALTFLMRCFFKQEAINKCPEDTLKAMSDCIETLSYWFVEKKHTTFSKVRALQHRASAIAMSTPEMPNSWWVDDTYEVLRYNGHKVVLTGLRKMCHQAQFAMVKLLEEDVLLGTGLSVAHSDLADDFSNTNVGYSVISDPRNTLNTHKDALLNAIIGTPALFSRFFTVNYANKVQWNVPNLHTWLRNLAKLELISIMSAEFTTGGPGRGTELGAMKFCNTPTRQRNLFAMGNYVAMVRMYQKSNALTGVDKLIPSAFDALQASLIIQTLTLARPFACLAASICFPSKPEVVDLYATQLWMGHAAIVKTEEITDLMKRYTGINLGVEFGMRDWRQISTSYRRKHTQEEMDSLVEQTTANTLDAIQMGHSLAVDQMHYGRTTEAFVGSEDVLPELLKRSIGWQRVCQVAPGMQVVFLDLGLQIDFSTTICNLNL